MPNEPLADVVRRLCEVDAVPLAMAVISMTGDLDLLEQIAGSIKGNASWANDISPEIRRRLAEQAAGLLAKGVHDPAETMKNEDIVRRMMSVAVGEVVSAEYVPMLVKHIGLFGNREALPQVPLTGLAGPRVVIVGAGISGICAALRLSELGIDYVVLEKNEDVGGTWFENTYPGCAVDTPSHFYQFSFLANNDWSKYFSPQGEVLDYLRACAEKSGVLDKIEFRSEVRSAVYCEERGVWGVRYSTAGGPEQLVESPFLISAVGQLNKPAIPKIEGLDRFGGTVMHTAQWNADFIPDGRRVALVGTGASAIQVGPAIADKVDQLYVLQRSGSWIVRNPNLNKTVSEDMRWALNNVPFFAPWYRFLLFWGFADGLFPALRMDRTASPPSVSALNHKLGGAMAKHMQRELADRPDLMEKCTPSYPPYGKRVLQDTGWYAMLRRPNVELVVDTIDRCEASTVILRSGRSLAVDTIILATGFQATRMLWPMDIRGKGGRSLRELWGEDDARAYMGMTVPDFPNFFIMFGPNTNLGHGGSAIFLAECQMRYIISCLAMMAQENLKSIEVKTDIHDRYNESIDQEMKSLVWNHPSVKSWYRNSMGRVVTNQPWRLVEYWRMAHDANPKDFVCEPAETGSWQAEVAASGG